MIFDTTFTCKTCWDSHPYCKSCYKLCGKTHYIYSVKNLNPENCPYINGYNDQYKLGEYHETT